MSDYALWKAYHKGNVEAFGALFERHRNRLFLLIVSWSKDPIEAEDILQEVFFKILEKGANTENIVMENFFAWAAQFARNVWKSKNRNVRRRAEIVAEEIKPFASTDCSIGANEDVSRIVDCFKKVRKLAHRRILVLVYHGYKNPDIAERMNKSVKWVKDNRCLAKKEFKRLLDERGLGFNPL